jgi:hypothetical protein
VPEILSALNSFNPDFLFNGDDNHDAASVILQWLKVSAMRQFWIVKFISVYEVWPHPLGLIELWDDYNFMYLCGQVWLNGPSSENPPKFSYNYTEILAQAPRQLIRILQACEIAPKDGAPLTFIRLVLNLSWPEVREAICYLRPVIGEDEGGLRQLFDSAFDPILLDLTYGYMRVLRSIFYHELPWDFRQVALLIYSPPGIEYTFQMGL